MTIDGTQMARMGLERGVRQNELIFLKTSRNAAKNWKLLVLGAGDCAHGWLPRSLEHLAYLPACQLPGPLSQIRHVVDVGAGQWLCLGFSEPSVFNDQDAVNRLLLHLGKSPC